MNRRELMAEGFRYLAQVLPGMAATAGGLGMLLRQPPGATGHRAACFPAGPETMAPPTTTLLPEEK
jgi:hypothetical protein